MRKGTGEGGRKEKTGQRAQILKAASETKQQNGLT